jgi:hypothetical protein
MSKASAAEFVASGAVAIQQKVSAFLAAASSSAEDGLTWSEFGELLVALLKLCVSVLDTTATLTGPEKKALVLDAVGMLFDAVAGRCVPLVAYPVWVLARPAVRQLVLALASGAIEQLLPLVRLAK